MSLTISGLKLSNNGTKINIASGTCQDSTGSGTISVPSGQTVTVDPSVTGFNGLDTGSLSPNKPYAVWLVKKSDGTVGGLFSLSYTYSGLTVPSGVTSGRRIGTVCSDEGSSPAFRAFTQTVSGNSRRMDWTTKVLVVNNASDTTWTTTNTQGCVSPESTVHWLDVATSSGAVKFRPKAGDPTLLDTNGTSKWGYFFGMSCPTAEFKATAGSSLTLNVLGYTEDV